MYEVYVSAEFEAAHRLTGNFGPAMRLHGHSYRMEVIVRGQSIKGDGTLCDIGPLRKAVDELAASLHYRDLDEVPGLIGSNTTAENVANFCWDEVSRSLRGQDLASLTVRIWENPNVYAAREDSLS